MTEAAPAASADTRPGLSYLDEAEDFARRSKRLWPFRFLRWFLRCSEDELHLVLAKVYCESLPRNWAGNESLLKTVGASLLHPFYIILTKTVLWRPSHPVVFDLETIEPAYFQRFFAAAYGKLQGSKRITPRHGPAGLPLPDAVESVHGTITLRSAALLFLAPLCVPWLLLSAPAFNRRGFLRSFRHALSVYAQFEGHFRRYPCRHFITYADEANHPSRWLAFKQHCAGSLVVVQNAERCGAAVADSSFAFGAIDLYLTFGAFMTGICAAMRVRVGRIVPVGSLGLNEFHEKIQGLLAAKTGTSYDILVPDQGVRPHNHMPEVFHLAVEKLLGHLSALKSRRPELRIAYQLRHYPESFAAHRNAVLSWLEGRFPGTFEVLDNPADQGESYFSVLRSELVVTFSSTMGLETLRLGRKALFVNYSGDPTRTICADPRYQIDDPSGDAHAFASRVEELLAARLDGPPEIALARHSAFDGRVQERIADALNGLG